MNERHFALSDMEYNLVTTLSNLLQSEDALHKYIADADRDGNEKVGKIFGELHDSNREFAKRLRECLQEELTNR